MRFSLVGYTGARPPVPTASGTVTPPDDPGSDPDFVPPDPLVVILEDGDVFHKLDYLALGYNHFDVVCIGGGGGRGADLTETIPASIAGRDDGTGPDLMYTARRYRNGGAGGGGGLHRVKGRLALLPSAVAVTVGAAGADAADVVVTSPFHDWRSGNFPPAPTTNPGLDGGATTFGTICQASGGKGGAGSGGSVMASPGGHGGTGGSVIPGDHIGDGTWDGIIGTGGSGGWGAGVDAIGALAGDPSDYHGGSGSSTTAHGAKGNYSAADPGWSAPGGIGLPFSFTYDHFIYGTTRSVVPGQVATGTNAIGGVGGGARTFPLDGSLAEWGSGGVQGWCEIRLTYLSL